MEKSSSSLFSFGYDKPGFAMDAESDVTGKPGEDASKPHPRGVSKSFTVSERMMRLIPIILIILIVLFIIYWWWTSYSQDEKRSNPVDYTEMIYDFETRSPNLWMTDDLTRLKESLDGSKYHYAITDSAHNVLYTNRPNVYLERIAYEVESAAVFGRGMAVRDKMRYMAIKVAKDGVVRFVRISFPRH